MIPAPVLEFMSKHWPKFLAVALIVLAFFLGWVSRPVGPERIVEKEVFKEKLVDKLVYVDRVRELTTEEMERIRDEVRHEVRRTEIREVVLPDGTRTRSEVSTVGIDTTTKEREVKIVEKIVEKEVFVDRIVDREVIKEVTKITTAPQRLWEVSFLAAVDVTQVKVLPVLDFPVGFGAQVQIHPKIVAGPITIPLSFGVFGTHKGVVGLTAGLEF